MIIFWSLQEINMNKIDNFLPKLATGGNIWVNAVKFLFKNSFLVRLADRIIVANSKQLFR